MEQLADDLFLLPAFPRYALNVYLMGGVLIDAGTRYDARRILRQLRGQTVSAHALTHAHPDHQGASRAVCRALNMPLWCGEADAEAVENPRLIVERLPRHWVNRAIAPVFGGPAHPVARLLREGDEVGGFTVIDTPGHSAGHVSYWRERDRTLILGDILANIDFLTGRTRLRQPPQIFTPDPARNRDAARKVAALEPALICFGHGPPLRNTQAFLDFVRGLPV